MELKKKTAMKYSLPPFWEHFNFVDLRAEEKVLDRHGSYKGLSPAALYTSDEDLLSFFNHPLVEGSFADLGCGVGKAPLLYGALFPDRKSIGIEFESSRLERGEGFLKAHALTNVSLLNQDLLSCSLPLVDTYFVYLPTGIVLDRILFELYQADHSFRILAIESHGDLYKRLERENWLELVGTVPLKSLRHHSEGHIYQRKFVKRADELIPFTQSFLKNFFLIEEHGEAWLGESYGMEWTEGDRFELLVPPRTIFWKNVKKMMVLSEIDPKYHAALALRNSLECEITTPSRKFFGFIRKIIINPTFKLELSTGERVEWDEILTIHQGNELCFASSLDS